jgi:hypothetical protein
MTIMESILESLLFWRSGGQNTRQDREVKENLRIQQFRDLTEAFMFLSDEEVCETLWINYYSSFSSFEAIVGYRQLRVQITWDRSEATVYVAPPIVEKPGSSEGPWMALSSILSNILGDDLGPRSAMIYHGPNARSKHLKAWALLMRQHLPAVLKSVAQDTQEGMMDISTHV